MDDLVERLSTGEHPVEVVLRPTRSLETLRGCLDRGYVHVKFTGTRGGTELTVSVDKSASDVAAAGIEGEAAGSIRLVGDLTLNYHRVRCIATIELATLQGAGHLELVPEAIAT